MGNFGETSKSRGRWFTIAGLTFAGIALAVLVAATVWQGNERDSHTSAAKKHTDTAAFLQESQTEAAVAAESLREYVKTGDVTLIPQIQDHATVAVKNLTDAISQGGVADLSDIAAQGGRLADSLGQVVALRQAGDVQASAGALEQLTPVFEGVTAEVDEAVALELQEASSRQSSAGTADDAASWLLIASIAWGVALGVVVTAVAARSLFGRRVSKTPSTI